MSTCIIFGGSGFIGRHFIYFLLENKFFTDIIVCDLNQFLYFNDKFTNNDSIKFEYCDVRKKINLSVTSKVDLIVNLAAIHREPGHSNFEYFETNILGAENITNFAHLIGCNNILFTSSISTYGNSDSFKDENFLTTPVTPYGISKLLAEKIHLIWQASDQTNRRLIIVRPGVVFGQGELGNVSRLINSVLNNYFFYTGNKFTNKAGVYVKELCNAMWWVFQKQANGDNVILFNMTMNPSPSLKNYVDTICKVKGVKRYFISVPYTLLLIISFIINFLLKPLRIKHPFSPVRIKKLVNSNNITPSYLLDQGYQYKYTLESSFLDWKNDSPEDWR